MGTTTTDESLGSQTKSISTLTFLQLVYKGIGSAVLLFMMPLQLCKSIITGFGEAKMPHRREVLGLAEFMI